MPLKAIEIKLEKIYSPDDTLVKKKKRITTKHYFLMR